MGKDVVVVEKDVVGVAVAVIVNINSCQCFGFGGGVRGTYHRGYVSERIGSIPKNFKRTDRIEF